MRLFKSYIIIVQQIYSCDLKNRIFQVNRGVGGNHGLMGMGFYFGAFRVPMSLYPCPILSMLPMTELNVEAWGYLVHTIDSGLISLKCHKKLIGLSMDKHASLHQ